MFINRLKKLRAEKKFSQAKLSEILGLSQQAIAKWETGKATPDPDMLLKLSKTFNVSIDYLLGNDMGTSTITESTIQTDTKLSQKREKLLSKLENLTDEELLEMEQIADYIKSKKEKNEQAATTA